MCIRDSAYDEPDTIRHILSLLGSHDFVGLSETRETEERKAVLSDYLPDGTAYFSSFLDQHSGGIALVIKGTFLKQFSELEWEVLERGRVAVQRLRGAKGSLYWYTVYFDPCEEDRHIELTRLIAHSVNPAAHCIIFGGFNFVCSCTDRFVKRTGTWSTADRNAAAEWHRCMGP
eukprot:8922632-Pyramimonas_sp.AAC.1